MPDSKYPESEKLSAVAQERDIIGNFLTEMADTKGAHLMAWVERDTEELCFGPLFYACENGKRVGSSGIATVRNCEKCDGKGTYTHHFEGYERVSHSLDDLLYEYFEVDPKALEQERRAMLQSMRDSYTEAARNQK